MLSREQNDLLTGIGPGWHASVERIRSCENVTSLAARLSSASGRLRSMSRSRKALSADDAAFTDSSAPLFDLHSPDTERC